MSRIASATFLKNHFPHWLHRVLEVGLDYAHVESAIGAGPQAAVQALSIRVWLLFDRLAVGVIKPVHEFLLTFHRHLPAVLDQTQQLLPNPVGARQPVLENLSSQVLKLAIWLVHVWPLHVLDVDRFELVVTVRALVALRGPHDVQLVLQIFVLALRRVLVPLKLLLADFVAVRTDRILLTFQTCSGRRRHRSDTKFEHVSVNEQGLFFRKKKGTCAKRMSHVRCHLCARSNNKNR